MTGTRGLGTRYEAPAPEHSLYHQGQWRSRAHSRIECELGLPDSSGCDSDRPSNGLALFPLGRWRLPRWNLPLRLRAGRLAALLLACHVKPSGVWFERKELECTSTCSPQRLMAGSLKARTTQKVDTRP